MRLIVHYFSATGNTARATGLMQKLFEEGGHTVATRVIAARTTPPEEGADLHIIAFPILSFAAPSFVTAYLKRLPKGTRKQAAVFATCGGEPGPALDRVAGILKRRGYEVVATGFAAYPDNWTQFVNPPTPERAAEMTEAGDEAARAFARQLLAGGRSRYRCRPAAGVFTSATAAVFPLGRRVLGKAYTADRSCTGCGLCARTCPSGSISMKGRGKRPHWSFSCADCGRCINLCPAAAVQTSTLRLILHLVLQVAVVSGVIMTTSALDRAVGATLARPLRVVFDASYALGAVVIGFWLQFGLVDRLLFALEGLPGLRRLFGRSFTAKYRRYKAPGFKAEA